MSQSDVIVEGEKKRPCFIDWVVRGTPTVAGRHTSNIRLQVSQIYNDRSLVNQRTAERATSS